MTPEEQITWTIQSLHETVDLPGWPRSRKEDLRALVVHLARQWQQYQTGTLAPDLEPPPEM